MSDGLYDGIRFLHFARIERYRCWKDKQDHSWYTIDYNHAGPMWFQVDDQPEELLQGPSLFFSFPGTRFRYGSRSEDQRWSQHYVAFDGDRVARYIQEGLFQIDPLQAQRPVVDPGRLLACFDDLHNELEKDVVDQRYAVWLLDGLLQEVARQQRVAAHGDQRDYFHDLHVELCKHPGRQWDFGEVAVAAGISERHLRRRFQQSFGLSPVRYLQELRLVRAAAKIRSSDWSISGIARWVGYADVGYFSRLFRKRFGLAPSSYRQAFA